MTGVRARVARPAGSVSRWLSLALALALVGVVTPPARAQEPSPPATSRAPVIDPAQLGTALAALLGALPDWFDAMVFGPPGTTRPAEKPPWSVVPRGKDGRFTILLLGSDWRAAVGGERMDIVIVMTIDPRTGRAAAASVPRDTIFFPRARSNGGGTSGSTRVNAMAGTYWRSRLPHTSVDERAIGRFSRDVEFALRTEIDAWVMIRFKAFKQMVDMLRGVRVRIPEEITDTSIRRYGAWFPEAKDYLLHGDRRCGPAPRRCHSALLYVRSRHGTVGSGGNNDFQRARRQQHFVIDAIDSVARTFKKVQRLVKIAERSWGKVYTSLPRSPEMVMGLLALLKGARLSERDSAVFGPETWAEQAGSLFTFRLRLREVRDWMNDRFGPLPR